MKFIRRLLPLVWLLGLGVLVVSFIGAARVLNSDPGPSAADADPSADPPPLFGGLVCFGHADVEGGILPLWPPTFPQPATVRKVLPAAKEGAKVKAGEVLAEFEDDLARFQVREAETALAQAEAKLAEAEKQAERGKKTHAQLIALQQIAVEGKEAELASKQQLLQHLLEIEKVFSGRGEKYNPHEIAAAREGVNALKKAVEAERKKLEQLKQNEPETEAALAQVRAAVERQKVLLEKARYGLSLTKLTAPSDGVILRSLVREGLQFGAQSKQPAFWFRPEGEVIVRAEVEQEFAHRVRAGESAAVEHATNPDLHWSGRVIRVADSFLPSRTAALAPDPFQLAQAPVLEFIVAIEPGPDGKLPRIGQKLRVRIGVE